MSGSGFPTVGLDVDLTKVDGAQTRLAALRAEFKGVGAEAKAASAEIAKANAAIAGEGAAPTSKLNSLSEARLKLARDVTAGLEAEATKQQLLAQKTVSAEAAALMQIQRDAQAFVEVQANLKATADAKQVAAEAAYNEKMAALVQQGLNDAQLMRVRQGVAELAELQAQNDKKLAMQRAYLTAQVRLTADAQIAQNQAAYAAAQAAYAAGKARTDAADRATTGVATGSAGFAVSGDAQDMAASIAATNAALVAQAGGYRTTAAAAETYAVAETRVAEAVKVSTQSSEFYATRQAAQIAQALGLSEAAGKAALAVIQQGGSMKEAAAAGQAFEQALATAKERGQALLAALDPLVAAQQRFNAIEKQANELLALGGLTQVEHARVTKLATAELAAAGVGVSNFAFRMREMLVVVREFMRGDFSRMAGSMTLLGQAFGAITPQLIAAALPWVALAAAIGLAAVAVERYTESQRKLAELAGGVGGAVGLTGDSLRAAAEAGASAANITVGAAGKLAETYAKTGAIGAEVMTGLIGLTRDYAEETGQKIPQAGEELAKAFADPARGAEELNNKLHFLNATELEHIEALAKSGQLLEAQTTLQDALKARTDQSAIAITGLAAAFTWLAKTIDDANRGWGNFFSGGAGNPTAVRIQSAQNLAAAASRGEIPEPLFGPSYEDQAAALQKQQQAENKDALNKVSVAALAAAGKIGYGGAPSLVGGSVDLTKRQMFNDLNGGALSLGAQAMKAGTTGDDPATIAAVSQAVERERHAYETLTTEQQRNHDVSVARQAFDLAKGNPTARQAAAYRLAMAEAEGKYYTQAEISQRATDLAAEAYDKASMAGNRHSKSIEGQIAALNAGADAALDAAVAYGQSAAAGDEAEARRKAVEKVTREGGTVEQALAMIHAQEAEAQARQIEGWAKAVTQLEDTNAVQQKYVDAVAAGTMSLADAQAAIANDNALHDKEAALATASGRARTVLLNVIREEANARRNGVTVRQEEQAMAALEGQRNEAAQMALQVDMLKAGNVQRAIALAQMREQQKIVQEGGSLADPNSIDRVKGAMANAKAATGDQIIDESYQNSLKSTSTALQLVADSVKSMGDAYEDAYGRIGKAVGGLDLVEATYAQKKADLFEQQTKNEKDLADTRAAFTGQTAYDMQVRFAAVQDYNTKKQKIDNETSINEQQNTLQEFDAFKGMFSQKSAAFKVLQGIEMAYYSQQFLLKAQAMATDIAQTVSTMANSGARSAVLGVEAVVRAIASMPFPLNLAAGAATAAAVAALGIHVLGGGGGAAAGPSAADLQKAAGTGSMLGDPTAKSDSLSKALANAEKYQDKQLGYSSVMTKSLQSIDANISGFTTLIARQLGVSGAFGTGGLGLGTTSSHGSLGTGAVAGGLAFAGMAGGTAALMSGFAGALALGPMGLVAGAIGLAIAALVKTTVTTALTDQGLNFPSQTVGAIGAGGFAGSTYQDVSVSSHKSLLGIGLGTSTKNVELSGALPDDFQRQATLIIQSLRSGILTAASTLGVDGAQAAVDAFTVDLGRISIKDLKTADIQAELEAVFSKAGDDMANAAAPFLANFQKAGEGLFQTLSRVATDYATIDTTLASIGKSFGATGLASIGARENLLGPDLFGSLDTFTSQVSAYADAFLSDAEKIAPVQAAVTKAMADMGYASVATKDQFKALVHSLDLTTADGQKTFAALLAIAPAFAQVADAADAAASANADAAAAALQAQQAQTATNNNLLVALFQAQGMTPEATGLQRKLTLDGITDPTQKALQQAVYDAQDRQAAVTTAATAAQTTLNAALQRAQNLYQAQAQTLQGSIDQFKQLGATLRDARAQLDVSNDNLSPLAQLANAQAQFAKILDTAKTGSAADSAAAMGQLTGAGNSLLQLAQQYAPSYQDYQRVLSTVKKGYEDTADLADQQVNIAQQQLDALTAQAKTLGLIDTGVTDLNTAFSVLAQAIAAAAKVNVKDPQWGAVQNMAANKALAAATGYAGSFGGGGFDRFIQSADLATRSNARDVLTQFGQTSRVDFSTADPQWGDYHNVDANKALAAALGYTGAFGGGAFDVWIKQQGADAKTTAANVLRQFGEASRIDFFANGTMIDQGVVTRPTAFAVAGEAGPEGILPLANVGGKLGVRAAGNDNGLAAAVNAVRDELAQMRLEQEELGLNQVRLLASLDRRDQKWDGDGLPATRTYG